MPNKSHDIVSKEALIDPLITLARTGSASGKESAATIGTLVLEDVLPLTLDEADGWAEENGIDITEHTASSSFTFAWGNPDEC